MSDDFPVDFAEPGHADLTWEWDDMHMPFALAPLAADYVRAIAHGLNEPYVRLGFPQRSHIAVWNAYAYFAYEPNVSDEERPAARERFTEACRLRAEATARFWAEEAIPELLGLYATIDGIAVDDLSSAELAAGWAASWAAALRAWEIHFFSILGPYQVVEDLADSYEAAVPGRPAGEALRLIQGFSPDLFDVALRMDELAADAARRPAITAWLRSGVPPTREALAGLHGGAEFLALVDAFLARHGHLGQAFDDLAQPSFAEEPSLLLAEIAKRLERAPIGAAARRTALYEEANRLAKRARVALAERPEELARFEHLLALGREIGHLTEGHNYWIDRMAQAKMRTLALRIGRRLVREGSLEEPADVLYLGLDEVAAAVLEPADRRPLITARKRDLEHWRSVRPPRVIGKPRDEGPVDRFEGERLESIEPGVLRGTGASAGIVRGPARVALSTSDFRRIQPGDVIVCPSSNPSWVPVFTIAAGLVTNTGGVLSHAAVVAREFGLPAVVGVVDATSQIGDGRTVEIDGTLGTVRLL